MEDISVLLVDLEVAEAEVTLMEAEEVVVVEAMLLEEVEVATTEMLD